MSEYNYIFDGNRPPNGFVLVAEAYHRAGKEIYPEQWGNLILHFTEEGAVFFKGATFKNLMNSIFLGIDELGKKNLWDNDTAKLTFTAVVREGIKSGTVKRALDKFELLIQKYPDINRKQARWEFLAAQCNNGEVVLIVCTVWQRS
ncbi:MAG: hypothetical protein L3J58_03690 [Emcibacter sp.]|nr:hypothetical protein [Emcibacter sp.]